MELTLLITAIAVMLNIVFCSNMWISQYTWDKLPARGSYIIGSNGQQFLYLQDFWSMKVGDWIGLQTIQIVFAHQLAAFEVASWWWIIWLLIALAAGAGCWSNYLLPGHKPDWGNNGIGHISWGGRIHSVYFGLNAGIAVAAIWLGISNGMTASWWISGIGGGLVWIACMIRDMRVGHFEPFKELRV